MADDDADAYPLAWPVGWPRTAPGTRKAAQFGSVARRRNEAGAAWTQRRRLTMAEGRDRVFEQLGLLRADSVVISTNVRVRADGQMRGDAREPPDPGAAVYFRLKGQPRVLACDRWDRLADNLAALAAHIDALRGIDRWGVGSLEQAFAGYRALAAMGERKPWYVVLGFREPPTNRSAAQTKYEALMLRHHPDRGGNPNQAAEVNAAWTEGRKAMGWA